MEKTKLFATAEKAALKNQPEKALDALEKILSADPNDVKALNKAADIYLKQKDQEKAVDYLKKIGEIYSRDGFYSKAIAIYKRILKIDEQSPKSAVIMTHEQLATLYGQLGLVSDAMAHFKIVVDFFDQENDREALLNVLRKVSDLDPNNLDSQIKLAELFVSEGKEEDAKDSLARLAESLEEKSQVPDLILVFEKWVQLFPKEVAPLKKLVETYLRGGEPKKALAQLQKAFRNDPYNAEVLELLSSTFVSMKQPEKAKAVDVELVKIYRKSGDNEKLSGVENRLKGGEGPKLFSETKGSSMTGDHSSVEQAIHDDSIDPADTLIKQMEMDPDEKKIISECEVYLKYGLGEKAREVLTGQLQRFPQSLPLRWRLKQVLQELNAEDEVVHAISEIILIAKDKGLNDWLKLAGEELKAIDPSHPSLADTGLEVKASSPEPELSADSKEPVGTLGDDAISENFDESEISIVVEDDLISEEQEAPDFASEGQDESFDLLSDDDDVMELSDDAIEDSGETPAPEEPGEDSGAEFLLSDADFSEDELQLLSNQLSPEESSKSEPPAEEGDAFDLDSALSKDERPPQEESPLELSEEVGAEDDSSESVLDLGEADMLALEEGEEANEQRAEQPADPSPDSAQVMEDAEFEIKQGLEEVAFFKSQNLNDEAEALLKSLKQKYPHHQNWEVDEPTKIAKDEKLNKKDVDLEALGAKMKFSLQEDDREDGEDFFDLAGELADELEEPDEEKTDVPAEVADVFGAFKQGVSESVSEDDFQTHFDLGIAYREMTLIDDAIKEFEICSKLDGKRAISYYQMGLSEMQRDGYEKAKEYFGEALKEPNIVNQEKISISYDLAEVLLKLDQKDEAIKLFSEVKEIDPEFRDVQSRLDEYASG